MGNSCATKIRTQLLAKDKVYIDTHKIYINTHKIYIDTHTAISQGQDRIHYTVIIQSIN